MKYLVLASSSVARREILSNIGLAFTVDPSNYEEDMSLNLPPKKLAIHLAKGKAEEVARRHQKSVVLAADSFAVFQNQLLGKPYTKANAIKMLKSLNGNSHSFITGYCLLDTDSGKIFTESVESSVWLRQLDEKEIKSYVNKEDVLNNAAAYRIQDLGSLLISRIEGDYYNVMGLPLSRVVDKLKDFGIKVL